MTKLLFTSLIILLGFSAQANDLITLTKVIPVTDTAIPNIMLASDYGTYFAQDSDMNSVSIIDAQTKRIKRKIHLSDNKVKAIDILNDSHNIVLFDGKLRILNIENMMSSELLGHTSAVTSISHDQSSNTIISGDVRGNVIIWNSQTRKLINSFKAHDKPISTVMINIKNNIIATGSFNGEIKIWNYDDISLKHNIEAHTAFVKSIKMINDQELLSSSKSNDLRIISINQGSSDLIVKNSQENLLGTSIYNKKHIFTLSAQSIRYMSMETKKVEQEITKENSNFSSLIVNPLTKELIVATVSGELHVFSLRLLSSDSALRSKLQKSVSEGDIVAIKTQIGLGANANIHTIEGKNLLSYLFTETEHKIELKKEIANILVSAGTKLWTQDIYHNSSLDYIKKDSLELYNKFQKIEDIFNEEMFSAIESEDMDSLVKTIIAGANINKLNFWDLTPLMMAVESEFADITRLLLQEREIDILKVNTSEQTVLDIAPTDRMRQLINDELQHREIQTQLLFDAIKNGDSEQVQKSIKDRAYVNAKDDSGETPLILATKQDSLEMVKILLSNGASPLLKANDLNFALRSTSNINIIKKLITNGADPKMTSTKPDKSCYTIYDLALEQDNIKLIKYIHNTLLVPFDILRCSSAKTPLIYSVINKKRKIFKYLMGTSEINIYEEDSTRMNAALHAIKAGNLQFLKALIRLGFNPNHVSSRQEVDDKVVGGFAPIHVAVRSNKIKAVKYLLSLEEIDINIMTNKITQWPALVYIPIYGTVEMLKLFQSHKDFDVNVSNSGNENILFRASFNNRPDLLKELLKNPDVKRNQRSSYSNYPLRAAITKGHLEILKLLLEDPLVDVTMRDINNGKYNIFYQGIVSEHVEIVEYLLDHHRVDKDWRPESQNSPIMVASYNKSNELFSFLVNSNRFDINKGNKTTWTPLMSTARLNKVEKVKILLAHPSIIPNLKFDDGFTALHTTARYGENAEESFSIIMKDPRVDINAKTKGGFTALHQLIYAEEPNHQVAKLLINNLDFNVKTTDDNGASALQIANRKNLPEIARAIRQRKQEDEQRAEDAQKLLVINEIFFYAMKNNYSLINTIIDDPRLDINRLSNRDLYAPKNSTVLHHALKNGFNDEEQMKLINILISHPMINLNIRANEQWTTLQLVNEKNISVFKKLLDIKGLDINQRGNEDCPILLTTKSSDFLEAVLKESKLDVNITCGSTPQTALQYWARHDRSGRYVKKLLAHKDIDGRLDPSGLGTPYEIAKKYRNKAARKMIYRWMKSN